MFPTSWVAQLEFVFVRNQGKGGLKLAMTAKLTGIRAKLTGITRRCELTPVPSIVLSRVMMTHSRAKQSAHDHDHDHEFINILYENAKVHVYMLRLLQECSNIL